MQKTPFQRLLHEPLLHFLLIGALLFAVFGLRNGGDADEADVITIDQAQVDALVLQWQRRWQRPPTAEELQGLIEQQVREEVLYREAVALGLDRGDPVVRRRLARKIGFIFGGISAAAEPSDAELQAHLQAHGEDYLLPARISFSQIYLNTARRGEAARDDARELLETLRQAEAGVDVADLGDPSQLAPRHRRLTRREVSNRFGEDFARALFELPATGWQGPLSSGYGLHLVRIEERTAARLPALAAVREAVRRDWLAQRQRAFDEAFYRGLRQRYRVVIEGVAETPSANTLASRR